MKATFRSLILGSGLGLLLSLPQIGLSQQTYERPTALAMAGDLVVARPALFVLTVAGTAGFIVGSPFSALGGNFVDSAKTLVVGPGKATFVRCLGCKNGRKPRIDNMDYDYEVDQVAAY